MVHAFYCAHPVPVRRYCAGAVIFIPLNMTENNLKLEARHKMRAAGAIWWFPPPRWLPSIQKWQREDIFGCFDFITISKAGRSSLVQITTIQHLSDRRRKIQSFMAANEIKHHPPCYVWAYNPKKGRWKIERIK